MNKVFLLLLQWEYWRKDKYFQTELFEAVL